MMISFINMQYSSVFSSLKAETLKHKKRNSSKRHHINELKLLCKTSATIHIHKIYQKFSADINKPLYCDEFCQFVTFTHFFNKSKNCKTKNNRY